jgi:4-hydroxy-tetrahydrodipicolinate synthase
MKLTGTYTALVTPFCADGSLDLASLAELVEWQIASGVSGLVPCGSTGESATLTHDEHASVVRHVVEIARGRVPVIAGTGSNSTREAIFLTQAARDAGADAALLISPYYIRPTQDGIYQHYREIARQVGLPMVLYSVPSRTASRIEPATVARLAALPEVIGLKDANGDLTATSETLLAVDDAFAVLSGDDALTLPMIALGATGVITTLGNVTPDRMSALVRAALAGDFARARALHDALYPLMRALFVESNPIPVKSALHTLGRIGDPCLRLPLTPMQKSHRDDLEATIARVLGR